MIGQYLPQTNESATVAKSKKISHLNKTSGWFLKSGLKSGGTHFPVLWEECIKAFYFGPGLTS